MNQESIDDIFKDLDLKKDTKASEITKTVSSFVQNEVVENKINDSYFNELLLSIKKDANYMSLKELLTPNSYDISDYYNLNYLKKNMKKNKALKDCIMQLYMIKIIIYYIH